MFLCFCTALFFHVLSSTVSLVVFYGLYSRGVQYLFLVMLLHVLSSTAFVVVFHGVYLGGVYIYMFLAMLFIYIMIHLLPRMNVSIFFP